MSVSYSRSGTVRSRAPYNASTGVLPDPRIHGCGPHAALTRDATSVNMSTRAALHDASARVGMFASRIPFSQLSKNDSSLPSEKKRSTLYLTPREEKIMVL